MKQRFTEEQIIGFLREADRGVGVKSVSQAWVFGGELLPLAEQVRRDGRVGRAAAEGAGGGECAAQEAADTRRFFETGKSRRFAAIANVAARKLAMLDAAHTLDFLRSPPGNRLEALWSSPHFDRTLLS